MKTIKLLLLTGLLMVTVVYSLLASEDVWNDVWYQFMGTVSCSATTATKVRDANLSRVAFSIRNPSSSYNVYYATSAITSPSNGMTIGPGETFYKDIYPYNGPIYVLTEPGQSAISVSFEETWR